MNILSFNLYFSGKNSNNIDLDIYNLLNEHNIDIVGFQEINYKTHQLIHNKLKDQYYSVHKSGPGGYSIFSKYKIINNLTKKSDYGNNIIIDYFGTEINIINVHLHQHYQNKIPFGPNLMKYHDINDVFDIINTTQLVHIINMNNNYDKTIYLGDFNNPSHMDTPYVEWPVSKYFYDNNFIDTFNFCNPSQKVSSIINCRSQYRSDMIYIKNLRVTESYFIDSNLDFDWFSDHKALFSKIFL